MIIATGNPEKGFAKELKAIGNIDFCSRSNGYDFHNKEKVEEFCNKSLKYNVFINNSQIGDFKQALLLKEVYSYWKKNKHKGLIINIGSTAAYSLKGELRTYSVEKAALRKYSLMLARHAENGVSNGIRVSFLAPGWIDIDHTQERAASSPKIPAKNLCSIVQWIIEAPENININEISLDAINNA